MSPIEHTKKFLGNLFRFGLSFALLFYLYTLIDVKKTVEVLKAADPLDLLYALIAFVICMTILLVRWLIYVRGLGLEIPAGYVTRYFFIGLFGNLFLPSAIGGDVIKVLGLCRYTTQKPKVVASVLLDRLSGFAGMVIVAIISYLFAHRMIGDASLMISILVISGASGAFIVVLFNEKLYSFCCRVFERFPKIKKNLMNLHYDVVLLKGRSEVIAQAVALSCVGQLVLAFVFYFVAAALQQDVPLVYFFIFVPLICVASSMPSIGGLGVREAGTVYLLSKVGVESGVAMSISLINFAFMVLSGLVGGLVYLLTKSPPLLDEGDETQVLSVNNSV